MMHLLLPLMMSRFDGVLYNAGSPYQVLEHVVPPRLFRYISYFCVVSP